MHFLLLATLFLLGWVCLFVWFILDFLGKTHSLLSRISKIASSHTSMFKLKMFIRFIALLLFTSHIFGLIPVMFVFSFMEAKEKQSKRSFCMYNWSHCMIHEGNILKYWYPMPNSQFPFQNLRKEEKNCHTDKTYVFNLNSHNIVIILLHKT